MTCAACRTDLPQDAQFCFECGYRRDSRPPYAEAAAAAEPDKPGVLVRRKTTAQVAAAPRPSRETGSGQAPAPDVAPRLHPRTGLPSKSIEISAAPGVSPSGPDQRAQRRYALVAEVTLSSEHNFYQGFAENLSEGGVFVATGDVHPVGTEFDVTFELPEMDRSCRLRCEVRWVRDHNTSRDLPPGMGLAFLELSRADERAMQVFLQHREPIFFDTD